MPTVNCNIHNRFDIEVIDAKSGEIKQRAQAENIILDALWTRLFTPASYFNYIHYGTGNGTPTASRTSLLAFLGYGAPKTGDDVYAMGENGGVASLTRKIQILENVAVGSTISEVGIAYGKAQSTLVTHAMLKDMNGNTVTIVKTATDIINIYATVFLHWPASGFDSEYIKVGYFDRNAYSGSILGWLSGLTTPAAIMDISYNGVSEASGQAKITATLSFSAASKTLTITMPRRSVSANNIAGGIRAIVCRASSAETAPAVLSLLVGGSWYPSTSIVGEAIGTGDGVKKDFAFAYCEAYNATIKVNGTAQSNGISIDERSPLLVTDMGAYFMSIAADGVTPRTYYAKDIKSLVTATGTSYWYNPFWSVGIKSLTIQNGTLFVSNDMQLFEQIGYVNGPTVVPDAYRQYKYFKFVPNNSYGGGLFSITANCTSNHIHFSTPPATGAIITADYTTKTVAKDANHVFDLTVTIQLGELIV